MMALWPDSELGPAKFAPALTLLCHIAENWPRGTCKSTEVLAAMAVMTMYQAEARIQRPMNRICVSQVLQVSGRVIGRAYMLTGQASPLLGARSN